MNNFYVYLYLDPRKPGTYVYGEHQFDYEPFYVGKGSNSRAYDHLKPGKSTNPILRNKVNKIKRVFSKPIIIIYKEMLLENVAFDLERALVKTIGRKDLKLGPLLNLTDAGEGNVGWIPSIKTRQKMKDSNKIRWSRPEEREVISNSIKELWKNDDYKKNVSASMKKSHNTKESKAKSREIQQQRWKDDNYREKRLNLINETEYRTKLSESIKKSWENDTNRKSRMSKWSKNYRVVNAKELRKNVLKTWKVNEIIIHDLPIWCKEHNINYNSFYYYLNKNKTYKGFTLSSF